MPAWTPDQITELIVTAYRRRGGAVASPADVAAALAYPARFPGINADGWTYLIERCHCLALGESVEERRTLYGWKKTRFQDGWRRAAAAIADGLNGEGRNTAQFRANEDAEGRLERSGRLVVKPPDAMFQRA